MNLFKIPKYQLYLLQLENYELGRYFRLLFKKGLWPKGGQRKDLVWTWKARGLFVLALLTHLVLFILVVNVTIKDGFSVSSIMYYVLCIVLIFIYFIFYTLYLILLWPFDFIAKRFIIARAKYKVKGLDKLKIIGIAGSYGKTTMKEVLKSVLSSKYQVLSTPESVNTPVGIARWVLKNFGYPFPNPSHQGRAKEGVEIAIVEMGEHYQGDIKDLCDITKPDIAVVTGINEAHLERMKKMETITDTIFEVVDSSKPGSLIVLNGDDENVVNNYKKYVWPDHKLLFFGKKNKSNFQFSIFNFQFNAEKLGWDAEMSLPVIASASEAILNNKQIITSPEADYHNNENIKIFINLLGEYAIGDVDVAIKIAKSLGMSEEEIKKGIANIKPVEHRLQPIKSAGDVLVVDDSYNGNPQGAAEAIKVLSRFIGRRKVYITPGLVETGSAAPDIHREIGQQLANIADVVILIKNSVTPYIEEGISSVIASKAKQSQEKDRHDPLGLATTKVVWFNTASEAHAALSDILKPGDVVLFQNDWGDQYI